MDVLHLEEVPAPQTCLDGRVGCGVADHGDAGVGPGIGDAGQLRVEEHVLLRATVLGTLRSGDGGQAHGCASGRGDHERGLRSELVDGSAGAGGDVGVTGDGPDDDRVRMVSEE